MATPLQKRKLMGEINVVPYIDVMLVLLVIFMVTAPLLTQGIEVNLPKANSEPIDDVPNHQPLVLSVDSAGNLYINVGDAAELAQHNRRIKETADEGKYPNDDEDSPHAAVAGNKQRCARPNK